MKQVLITLAGMLCTLAAVAASAEVILSEPNIFSGDQHGFAVALSNDGTFALVGAPSVTVKGANQAGKVSLYVLSQGTWHRTYIHHSTITIELLMK